MSYKLCPNERRADVIGCDGRVTNLKKYWTSAAACGKKLSWLLIRRTDRFSQVYLNIVKKTWIIVNCHDV
jgi:hypothetical protein